MISVMRFLALILLLSPPTALAQETPATLTGVVFDSLGGAPLSGAFVVLQGGRVALADDRGRFEFDSVAPGTYTVVAQHPALDSSGLSGIGVRALVPGPQVIVATPSFAALWRVACGERAAPADSGFVYGTVREAKDGRPVGDAVVTLTWLELQARRRTLEQYEWRADARTDRSGTYGICGVPLGATLRVWAAAESLSSGTIDVVARRVQRRDLTLGALNDGRGVGVVVGHVTDSAANPVVNARAISDGLEVRTDDDGRFMMRDVPTGTRQLSLVAIGYAPAALVVDVAAGDTTVVSASMASVRTLDVVNVRARTSYGHLIARGIEERRRVGLGYITDSTTIGSHGTLASLFAQAPAVRIRRAGTSFLVMFPVRVQRVPGENLCMAAVWIDGRASDQSFLNALRPDEIAAIEVYSRFLILPMDFMGKNDGCGVIAVWTKRAFH